MSHPTHSTLSQQQTLALGAYPDVTVIRENNAFLMLKSRATAQTGDIATFRFNSYGNNKLLLKLQSHPILGDEDHANYVHATEAIVKVGAVGSATNATSVQINTANATQYIEVRNAVHGNASNPLRLQLTKTAERDDDFSGETEFEFTLAFVAPAANGITGDANYKLSADANAANERFGLFSMILTATDDQNANGQTANVVGRIGMVPHVSVFKVTAAAAASTSIAGSDDFSTTVDRVFTVTADGHSSDKFYNFAKIEASLDFATTASFSAAQTTGGIFSVRHAAPTLTDANGALKVRAEAQTYPAGATVSEANGVTTYTFANIAAATALAGAAQFGRLIGAQLYDGNTAKANAFVIHKNVNGTTVTIVVSGTNHATATPTFQLTALAGQQQGNITSASISLRAFKGAPDAINNFTGDLPTIKNKLTVVSNMQENNGTVSSTDNGVLTITTPSFLSLTGGSVAAVDTKISASVNQMILSTKALVDAGATFALNGGRTECVISLPVSERDITSVIQGGQDADIVSNADTPAVAPNCTNANITVATADNAGTGGKTITITAANGAQIPADFATASYAIMGADATDGASQSRAAFANLDAKFAKLQSADESGAKANLYLNTNQLNKHAGSLVISGSALTTTALKVGSLSNTRGRDVTVTVDREAAFTTAGGRSVTTMDVSANHGIQADDILSQVGNAVKATVDSVSSNTLTLKADYEGHFDTSADVTKYDSNDQKYYLMHDQDITLPATGSDHINVGHIILDKNGRQGKVKTKHNAAGGNRKFTLEKSTGIFATGQTPLKAGAAGSETTLQTNEFKFTTLAATANPASGNAVLQAGTVTAATLNATNLATVDNQDGTKTHTINVDVSTYEDGVSAFDNNGLLTVNGKALKYQAVKLSGNGTASSAVNANQTTVAGEHIKINDTLTGIGAVKAIKVKLTVGATITTAISVGETITQRGGETVGTSTAAHNANALTAGSQLEVLVTTDTKPFDATGTGITVDGNAIAVTAVETTLLVDNTTGNLAANDNPKVAGKIGGSAGTIQLQEITLNNQYTTAGAVGQTISLAETKGKAQFTVSAAGAASSAYVIILNDGGNVTGTINTTNVATDVDDAAKFAGVIRTQLSAIGAITAKYNISGAGAVVAIERKASGDFTITSDAALFAKTSVTNATVTSTAASANGYTMTAHFQATGTIMKVTVDGNNTKYMLEVANGGDDFTTATNATVNNIPNQYERVTVDADIKTHLGNLPTADAIVQKTGNAAAGSATVTASDNTNKYIYATNNTGAAFVASTNKTDLTVNQAGWAQEAKGANANIVLSAFNDGDVVQGMYVTGSGIKPNTIVASATHGTNTITLDKAATLDHGQALHFHDDTIKLDGASHPTGFIELDISALVTSHGFILPPADSVVSQGNVTGTVQSTSASGKIILKTAGNGAASDAFTTATALKVNIGGAGAKEQNFQKVTVSADNSALGKLSDLTAVATINDTTASTITQLDNNGNEVARGYLRALAGAVATVQVESGTFVTTNTHPLHYGGNTHRYVSLTLPTAAILATEKNASGLLQNGNVLTDGTHSGVIRSSSINGSNTIAVVEYTTNQAAGNITGGNLTINGKFQATQTITVTTNDNIFGDDILPNADTIITQGNATGTVISKAGQVLTVRLDDTNAFANDKPLTYNSIVHNRVVLTLSHALSTDTDLNGGGGFAANDPKWVFQVGTNATGQTLLDESGTTLTLINVTGTFNDSGELRRGDNKTAAETGTKLAVDAVTRATFTVTISGPEANDQANDFVITVNDNAITHTTQGSWTSDADSIALGLRTALNTAVGNGTLTGFSISGADEHIIITGLANASQFTVKGDTTHLAAKSNLTDSNVATTNGAASDVTLLLPTNAGVTTDFVDAVSASTVLAASANTQVLQSPSAATTNPGLKPVVSGKYYSLSAVQAATQVQPSAVTIGQMTASTVTNHNATPLNANGTPYSGSNATLDITGAGAPVSGQTRRTVSSVLSPSFKVTPAIVGKLANTGTGFTDNAAAPVTATYTAAATSQDLAFQFGHGSYTEQIAAFRFRVTVTCDGSSEKFNVTVHTFSTPSLYLSKYLKTGQKTFVDDATNYEDATISATTGNVQVGGSDSNSGSGTVSSKWQVFREDAGGTFFQNIIGTTPGFAQVNSRLGGGISDYLPILESETLVVASKSGQDVFFKHKSTYDLFDLAGTPAAYPVSDDIAKLITSRNLAANSNDTIRIGNADYSLQSAAAVVVAVSGINQLKITFKGGLDIAAIAADQALNLKLAGANTKHNRFDLLTSADGAVSNTSVGPFKVRAVAANWASSEASAGEAYSEKVLLVYHDDTDDKSYVVSSVEVGLQVANTDDGSNFQIKSNMNGETIKVFREDIIAYPSTTDGLPIIFASATGGDDAYTFSLAVTGVVSGTTNNGNMNKPANRAIQGNALADQLFVSTGDVTSYNYSSGVDPNRILTASINLRDHSSSVGTSNDAETFAVTYQPTQTFNSISGFTSQAGATIGAALTTNVTVLNTTGSISGFSAGGIHAWDRGIGNNVDLASVNIAAAVAITFDSKGLALKVHLVNEGGQNKLKMTTTGAWNGIDNAAVGAGKSTRNVTYGLQGNEANYYRLADRFITGHATGTDGGAASNRYFMTTTGMTAGKALKGYLEYQTAEKSTTANGAVTGNTTKIVTVADKAGIEVGDSLLPTNVIVRGTVNNAAATIVASLTVQSINGGNNEITLTSADDRFTGVQIANGAALTFRETHTVTVGMVTNVFTHACSGTDTENTLNLDTENTNVVAGMVVSGTGIREGTTVVSKNNLALTLTNAAGAALTADITNGAITFRADGYVYQADNGTVESATLVNNGVREGGKFTVVSGTGEGNAIPGRAFASNSIDVHVYRDATFRLEDTTTSNATRTNVVSSNLTGTGNAGQAVVAMSDASSLTTGMVVGPTVNGGANTANYTNPIADDTTITQISGNNITLSNNLAAALSGTALTFYSVPQRTIHGSIDASTDTKLVRYRTATADGKTGIGAAGNVTKLTVVGSGLHADAQGADQTAATIADGGAGSLISLTGDKIFASAPTAYTSEVTIKVQDVNAEAVAQLGGTGIPFGAGVAQHTQQFKLKVIPDPVLAVKTNAVATLNVFDKLLVHEANIFKVKANYFADSFNKASMTLNNGGVSTVNASKTDITSAGTLDLLKSGAGGVAVVKATIPAPNAVHTDLNFLKLNIDGANGYVANTHQALTTEITYTGALSDVSKVGAGDAAYTNITGNVLLTSKTTDNFLAKLTRHHNPQILQNAKKANAAINNVDGQRFTHSATSQTNKASWNFTEFTGRTLGGTGAATTDHYHNIYTIEKSNGVNYAHDDAILTTNHGNTLYPNMQLTSNTSSDSGNFATVKITGQPKYASSIADGATIPTNLTNDETYLKATFTFTSNNLAGEGTESITYTFADKLTTKAHPHIRFNHRTTGSNTSVIQSETENAVNSGKAGNLPWLVYTADNLASNAPFADWAVTGDTGATTSIRGDTTGKNVSIVTDQTKLKVGTATAYAEADAFKHVFLRRALAGYDGPKGLAQDADGIRLTISEKPVITVLNRENEANQKYLGLTSTSVNALRNGIKTGDKVHPIGDLIGSDPTQAQFDVGNADGAAGKNDVALTFANGLASFKAIGHGDTSVYPGFNFSDSYAIANGSGGNTHFNGSAGSVGFLRMNSGALSIEANTTNITTRFTNGSGFGAEPATTGVVKKVARDNNGGFTFSTSGQTIKDIDANGHAFFVQGGRRATGGAVTTGSTQASATVTIGSSAAASEALTLTIVNPLGAGDKSYTYTAPAAVEPTATIKNFQAGVEGTLYRLGINGVGNFDFTPGANDGDSGAKMAAKFAAIIPGLGFSAVVENNVDVKITRSPAHSEDLNWVSIGFSVNAALQGITAATSTGNTDTQTTGTVNGFDVTAGTYGGADANTTAAGIRTLLDAANGSGQDLAGFTIGGADAAITITGLATNANFGYKGNAALVSRSNLANTNTVTTTNGSGDGYTITGGALNGLAVGTGATLVVPPRLAYKSTATPTTNATDTFDITYTQLGSKLLSTDTGGSNQGFTTITSVASSLTFNVLKNLNETVHIADNITASAYVSNSNANTGLALSGTTITDATVRNYYYAQTLTPSGNNAKKLLAVYFNRTENLAQITDGSARVANKSHGNLHSITKDDGTVNQTNHAYFHVETTSNREAFGVYLHNTTQEGNFKGSTQTVSGLTMKLKPNGYSSGQVTLDVTGLKSVKAPMTESLNNTTGLGNIANVSGGVVVYDGVASKWQTVVPDSTTTDTTSDAPANVWAAYGDGSTGTGSTYNDATGTTPLNGQTSPLWSMATLDPTNAQTALTTSNVAFSSTTAAHGVAGEQWASLAGAVQAGANGATSASSANALFQRYYADADKVKTLTHPNWVGTGDRHKLDPTATITGAFRTPLENTGAAGTFNVADNLATTDASARGTDSNATNTVTLSRTANTYNVNVVVKMTAPQKFSLAAKPSLIRHADDANLGTVTNRTRSKIMESQSTATTTALAHFGPESGGNLGNRLVCFTDLNDLRDALVADGKRQLTDRENRFELDSTPTALARTSTVVGVARYADATVARRFQLEEHNNKATLSVVLSGADAFYKQNVSCVIVLDTLGESPNDIRVGDFVYQSGLSYTKGVAPNNKTYEQTFGKVILVSSNPPTIKVEFAGLEVNDLHNKAIMDSNFATQVNETNPGARRGWSQPGYQKTADKTDGESHGDGSSVSHIPFITSGGDAAKKLTLIRGYVEATNTTSNANVKAFQAFDVSSVVVSTSNLTRRLSVNSAMVGRLGSGKTYAIYSETTGTAEGEQFIDLKITTTGGDSFTIAENSVSDRVFGRYADSKYGDVTISDSFKIGKLANGTDHSAAAQGGFEVFHDSGNNYTFRLGGTANNSWSTIDQVTSGTGTIAGNALTTLTLTASNTFVKQGMVVHGHANIVTGTTVQSIDSAKKVITLSTAASGAINAQVIKFSNDLDDKLLQSADLTALHTSFVVRENAEGDTVFVFRINNSPAPTATQFQAELIAGISQVTGNTLGQDVLALGGGQGAAAQAKAMSMRSEQQVELAPYYVIQTVAPKLSSGYPRSTLPETPYTREVVFNSVVDANQSFDMDMSAGNSSTTAQAQWGANAVTVTLAGADVADLRFGSNGTKTRTASITNGSPTVTLLGHVSAVTTGASSNTTVPVAATGLATGMKAVGTGVPAGTTITVNGNTVTASGNITVSSGATLFFTRSTTDDEEAKLVAVNAFDSGASTIELSSADATIITGTSVSGPGIASGTVVTGIASNVLTLSNATTATTSASGNLIFERSVFVGMTATSGSIPASTYVTAVSGNTVTLSANATGTATGQISFSNIGPGAYVTTDAGTGIRADTHVISYNGTTTVTINQQTSAAQGQNTAVSFKMDSQYDNIVAVSGGTSFTPESYIYRLDRHLKTYKLTYVQSTVSAFGKLALHTEQGGTATDRTTDTPSVDSHGIALINNRRYLILAVEYAERGADTNPTVTTTYNGYYKYDSQNEVFLYDNASGVSSANFGMDTGRVEPTANTNIGPYRMAIIPSGDGATYKAYKGGHAGNQAMADIGGVFSTSSALQANDTMAEIKTNGSTKPTFQRMTQLIRNEGAQYTRGSSNGFPYYRIQDVPSRLDHSDLVIILLRADANTNANSLTLKYDRIMNGDSIQAYQLRGAVDYSGMSSDINWAGNDVVGTTSRMPVWYLNGGTELVPEANRIELSKVNPSPLAAADTAIFAQGKMKTHQFLHHETSGTSLHYSRVQDAMVPTGADSVSNFSVYDSTKKVFKFRAANSLVLDQTESLPLFD